MSKTGSTGKARSVAACCQPAAGWMCWTEREKLREAAVLRRNHCQRMATGAKPDIRIMEM